MDCLICQQKLLRSHITYSSRLDCHNCGITFVVKNNDVSVLIESETLYYVILLQNPRIQIWYDEFGYFEIVNYIDFQTMPDTLFVGANSKFSFKEKVDLMKKYQKLSDFL